MTAAPGRALRPGRSTAWTACRWWRPGPIHPSPSCGTRWGEEGPVLLMGERTDGSCDLLDEDGALWMEDVPSYTYPYLTGEILQLEEKVSGRQVVSCYDTRTGRAPLPPHSGPGGRPAGALGGLVSLDRGTDRRDPFWRHGDCIRSRAPEESLRGARVILCG